MVICLERVADLHMAQLMPLPLTVFCFSKIQIGFTFLVPAHPGRLVPDEGSLNGCVCVSLWTIDAGIQTDNCSVMRALSPSRRRNINTPATVTVS